MMNNESNGGIVMKKLPKLYTKNDKGQYEEYQIPEMDVSDTLYRKINGKYVPTSVCCVNDLPEGIWVVTRETSYKEYLSGQYLKERMQLDKVSDIKDMPNLAELGGWKKCADWVINEMHKKNESPRAMSNPDLIYAIVGKIFEYSKKINKDE